MTTRSASPHNAVPRTTVSPCREPLGVPARTPALLPEVPLPTAQIAYSISPRLLNCVTLLAALTRTACCKSTRSHSDDNFLEPISRFGPWIRMVVPELTTESAGLSAISIHIERFGSGLVLRPHQVDTPFVIVKRDADKLWAG